MGYLWANNAASKLSGSLLSGGLSLDITPGDGSKFPSPSGADFFVCTIVRLSDLEYEIIRVTSRTGDQFDTILRGQENTTPLDFSDGDLVENRPTAAALADIASKADFQGSGAIYAADIGVANAVEATYTPAPVFGAGLRLMARINNTNTDATTFDGTGVAYPVRKYGTTEELDPGDLQAGMVAVFEAQESPSNHWQLISTPKLGTSARLDTGTDDAEVVTGTILKSTAREYDARQSPSHEDLAIVSEVLDWDMSLHQSVHVNLDDNITTLNFSNLHNGAWYSIRLQQDNTGGRTVTWPAIVKWAFGVEPTLSTDPLAIDLISFQSDGTNLYGVALTGFA